MSLLKDSFAETAAMQTASKFDRSTESASSIHIQAMNSIATSQLCFVTAGE